MEIKQKINDLEMERKELLSKAKKMTDKEMMRLKTISSEIESFKKILNANERTD